jgi:hypothetical protein
MLSIANIKNVSRYFKTPSPQVLQAMANAPHEPDAMTIAAKANYERVKSDTAQKMGEQQFNIQKQAQDEAYRRDRLAQEHAYQADQIRVAETKNALDHQVDMAQIVADMAQASVAQPGQSAPPPPPQAPRMPSAPPGQPGAPPGPPGPPPPGAGPGPPGPMALPPKPGGQ